MSNSSRSGRSSPLTSSAQLLSASTSESELPNTSSSEDELTALGPARTSYLTAPGSAYQRYLLICKREQDEGEKGSLTQDDYYYLRRELFALLETIDEQRGDRRGPVDLVHDSLLVMNAERHVASGENSFNFNSVEEYLASLEMLEQGQCTQAKATTIRPNSPRGGLGLS